MVTQLHHDAWPTRDVDHLLLPELLDAAAALPEVSDCHPWLIPSSKGILLLSHLELYIVILLVQRVLLAIIPPRIMSLLLKLEANEEGWI